MKISAVVFVLLFAVFSNAFAQDEIYVQAELLPGNLGEKGDRIKIEQLDCGENDSGFIFVSVIYKIKATELFILNTQTHNCLSNRDNFVKHITDVTRNASEADVNLLAENICRYSKYADFQVEREVVLIKCKDRNH